MSETHFPLDESKLPFSIPKDAQPREKILKQHIKETRSRLLMEESYLL